MDNLHSLMMEAADALERGDNGRAKEIFTDILSRDGNYFPALYNLGVICCEEENTAEAEKYFMKALETRPDDPDILTELGNVWLKGGESSKAEEFYRRAEAAGGSNEVLFNNLGVIFFRRQDYREAKKLFKKALKINPDYKEARENTALANFYLAMM